MEMVGFGLLGSIVVGLVAGWVATRLTRSEHGLSTNLFLGVLGAVAMGWLARRVNFTLDGLLENLIGAVVGAIGLITIYQSLTKKV